MSTVLPENRQHGAGSAPGRRGGFCDGHAAGGGVRDGGAGEGGAVVRWGQTIFTSILSPRLLAISSNIFFFSGVSLFVIT